jgi:hypothetical protein
MDGIWQSAGTSVSGSPSIGLLRQDLAAVLEHNEEAVAMGRERKTFWRRHAAFDAVNAHSQGDEPPLSFVMEFNAAESEWREAQARLKKMLDALENGLRR